MEKKMIMMVEDEEGIRELTKKYLTRKGYDVITASDGQKAMNLLDSFHPDLILLDIEMPGLDGFSVCQAIRRQLTIPIIFLTVRRDIMDKVRCFELGGDDYITKPFEFEELNARIKANIRRYVTYPQTPSNILKIDSLTINLDNLECYVDDEKIELSAKEIELLMFLVNNPNQVLSQEQLYDQVWDIEGTGNIDTVKVHVSHLRRKIEKDPRNPQFIRTVRGFGYMFSRP